MADRPISSLTEATAINDGDYFVLQQDNEAKRLMGDNLKYYINHATGVTNVEYIGSTGLVDRYRMYYNNRSTTFDVANGKSITRIYKTSSSTTYDTYAISFNDNTTTYFTVPYGKDCTINSTAQAYAGSTSASSIPASTYWSTSVSGAITLFQNKTGFSIKGHYLWTRSTFTYSTGGSYVMYSLAYQGLDGHGAVDSVNGQAGDVLLSGDNLTVSSSDATTIDTALTKREVLIITSQITSLPKTISNGEIESDMVCLHSVLDEPNVQADDWTITTNSGNLTISGTLQGSSSTNITLYLMKSR